MHQENKKILVVDDEPKIVEVVAAYLENSGYATLKAYNGKQALTIFQNSKPDLVILDLMLPELSGEEVCRAIRRISRVPIIMVTAKIDEDEKIEGLNIGADDYVTKPFSPRELMARVNSLLRRSDSGVSPLFRVMSWNQNDLEVDLNSLVVKKAGAIVNLTPNEFKLLCTMIKYPKKIFTREELIEIIFGIDYDGFERTIDTHIKNLRSKIEDDTANPRYIITVRGIGYRFGDNL
ncbi:MAG: response regulator transcription factor [Lachnospiraceae bacterium]|nr:response regulator transcription factor [Lachnospiraceae bacterium]